jgi:hypothetical protein
LRGSLLDHCLDDRDRRRVGGKQDFERQFGQDKAFNGETWRS